MTFGSCPRENDLAILLERGHWPDAAQPEFRAHVAACRACSDLALVRTAFRADRSIQCALPRLESPGVLWWRAQLRRRNASLQQIGRPLLSAQIFAAVLALLASAAFLVLQYRRNAVWLSSVEDLPRFLHLDLLVPDSLQKYGMAGWLVLCGSLTLTVAGGVFVYIKSEKR